MFDLMFWVWVILAAFFIIAEIITAGFFLAPFGIGAAIAAVLAYFNIHIGWQWFVFLVISIILLIYLRHFSERFTHDPPEKSGAERLVGKTGRVIEDLTPHSRKGKIRVEREEWRADGPEDRVIEIGTTVTVKKIEGTHLIVVPENQESEKEE